MTSQNQSSKRMDRTCLMSKVNKQTKEGEGCQTGTVHDRIRYTAYDIRQGLDKTKLDKAKREQGTRKINQRMTESGTGTGTGTIQDDKTEDETERRRLRGFAHEHKHNSRRSVSLEWIGWIEGIYGQKGNNERL